MLVKHCSISYRKPSPSFKLTHMVQLKEDFGIEIFKIITSPIRVLVSYDISRKIHEDDLAQAIRGSLGRLIDDYKAIRNPKTHIDLEEVQRIVCKIMKITPEDMNSKCRSRHIVVPRQVAHAMAVKYTHFTISHVGKFFGGKDHATVLHSSKVVWRDWIDDTLYGYGPIVTKVDAKMLELSQERQKNLELKEKWAQFNEDAED